GSSGGETSTRSAPATSSPASARITPCASRTVIPPASVSRCRGSRRVDDVNVEGDVGWAVADDGAGLTHHVLHAAFGELLDKHQANARRACKVVVGGAGDRPADADLDHPFRVDQVLLDRTAKRRAVVVAVAEEAVVGVGVRIDVD